MSTTTRRSREVTEHDELASVAGLDATLDEYGKILRRYQEDLNALFLPDAPSPPNAKPIVEEYEAKLQSLYDAGLELIRQHFRSGTTHDE